MMKTIYNVVRGREYDAGQGQKTAWDKVGILIVDGDKISLRLETIPVGEWDGWLKAFPKDEAGRNGAPAHKAPAHKPDFNDDIPF